MLPATDRVSEELCLEKIPTKRSKFSEITLMFITYQHLDFAHRGNLDSSVRKVDIQVAGTQKYRNWILQRSNRFIRTLNTSSGAGPDDCSVGNGGHFPGLKRRRGVKLVPHIQALQISGLSCTIASSWRAEGQTYFLKSYFRLDYVMFKSTYFFIT